MSELKYPVGAGWQTIVGDAITVIENYLNNQTHAKLVVPNEHNHTHAKVDGVPKLVIDQIKEKFGHLRMYVRVDVSDVKWNEKFDRKDYHDKRLLDYHYVQGVIAYAEFLSTKTCEYTGKVGTLRTKNGWMKTVCDEVAEQQGFDPIE